MDLNEMVGATVLSQVLGVSHVTISNLAEKGVLHPIGNPRKYVLKEAVQDYLAYLEEQVQESEQRHALDDVDLQKQKADLEYKQARADMAQLEYEHLEENMHRSEDVKAAFGQFAFMISHAIEGIPGRTAPLAMKTTTAAEAADVIRRDINDILVYITKFEYDPDFDYDPKCYEHFLEDRSGSFGEKN